MKTILLLGSGGREHALAWKIAQSPLCSHLYIAPGNAGTEQIGTNVPIDVNDFQSLKTFAVENKIDMVVVGPEDPLVRGIYDNFQSDPNTRHISIIGPSKDAAALEGSKNFAKAFMQRHNIPTAKYKTFDSKHLTEGLAFLHTLNPPYVLKADGLCAGKGVLILPTLAEAERELVNMLQGKFGSASSHVVIEEFLQGEECSVFVLTDGEHYKVLPVAKDYKRIGEGNQGPNTGGMGAISPVSFATKEWMERVEEQIIRPTIVGLSDERLHYKGFLFFGLINVDGSPKVIEYNCRMGDPETQCVMLRLKSDLLQLLIAVEDGKLNEKPLETDPRAVACIVLASKGYPAHYKTGYPIHGIDNVSDSIVFHQATTSSGPHALSSDDHSLQDPQQRQVLTAGGRVLAVASYGNDVTAALANSYRAVEEIHFTGKYFRRDIGS